MYVFFFQYLFTGIFQSFCGVDAAGQTPHGRVQPSEVPRGTSETFSLLYYGQKRVHRNQMSQSAATGRYCGYGLPSGLYPRGNSYYSSLNFSNMVATGLF